MNALIKAYKIFIPEVAMTSGFKTDLKIFSIAHIFPLNITNIMKGTGSILTNHVFGEFSLCTLMR